MRDKIAFAIICLFISSNILAKEPVLATLNTIYSNKIQKFSIGTYTFECRPYGVLTLENLYYTSNINSLCRKSIDNFYKKNPKSQEYVLRLLKDKQKYHIEIKNTECIVFAKGQMTLSELLLHKGLAVLKPIFKDAEFASTFLQTQIKAKREEKGLWGVNIYESCVAELYK
ncbi:MAG: hypothetical protein ACJAWW_002101 [Sulfurimonas sp.]|jgi:hypothetical protein